MSTLTAATRQPKPSGSDRPVYRSAIKAKPVHFAGVAYGEWIKLVSLRSTIITAAAMVVLWNGFVAMVSYAQARTAAGEVSDGPGSRPPGFMTSDVVDSASQSSAGAMIAQLVVVVLAGLALAGEYSTGTIRSTLLAAPRRTPVLLAKLAVVGGCVLVLATISAFTSFFVASAFLSSEGLDTSLSDPHQLQIVVGSALYVTVAAIFTLGIAAILRHVAGTIASAIALLLLLPMLVGALPSEWSDVVRPWLPSSAGMQILAAPDAAATLQPWQGLAVFAGYALVLVTAGWWTLKHKDA